MKGLGGRASLIALIAAAALVTACSGGGGGGDGGTTPTPTSTSTPTPTPTATPTPTPTPTPTTSSGAFATEQSTARFLTQASFGPTKTDIALLSGTEASDWFLSELNEPISLNLPTVLAALNEPGAFQENGLPQFEIAELPTELFWKNAIEGPDQLRQRVAFALSEIMVISATESADLFQLPSGVAYYQDVLARNALGNYRDLLDEVTYSPAMAIFLTYLKNRKADPTTGQMPDENYAREVMQLFTIGVVELNNDGTVRTDGAGNALETYDNDDVTGLAKVFTGLSFEGLPFWAFPFYDAVDIMSNPLVAFDDFHSDEEKAFLGAVIPAGTDTNTSIEIALDALVDHPNTPPFVSRQLIQRLVTSHPSPNYVERVANSFASGRYTLPSGDVVGDGRRGDLAATVAAILFDDEARLESSSNDAEFGKAREPIISFINWARAFDVKVDLEFGGLERVLWNIGSSTGIGQAAYKSPSVFNFFRPGYVPPGTRIGDAGLTAPEFQIINSGSIAGYANVMTWFITYQGQDEGGANDFVGDYSDELALAGDPPALIAHLNDLLAYGALTDEAQASMVELLEEIFVADPTDFDEDGVRFRVQLAILLVLTSPDYVIQK